MIYIVTVLAILIFLESSEVFQSFITQPLFTSLFFIFLGVDSYTAILAAIVIQLFFLSSTPSGASIYPEYPTGYFITLSAYYLVRDSIDTIPVVTLVSIALLISLIFSILLYYKRKLVGYLIGKLSKGKSFREFRYIFGFTILFLLLITLPFTFGSIKLISMLLPHTTIVGSEWLMIPLAIGVSIGMIFNYYKNSGYRKFILSGNVAALTILWVLAL